jgi:hypothetical protein
MSSKKEANEQLSNSYQHKFTGTLKLKMLQKQQSTSGQKIVPIVVLVACVCITL